MSQRDDWLPMMVETVDQRNRRQELFLVYAGPLVAVLCLGIVLSYAMRAI